MNANSQNLSGPPERQELRGFSKEEFTSLRVRVTEQIVAAASYHVAIRLYCRAIAEWASTPRYASANINSERKLSVEVINAIANNCISGTTFDPYFALLRSSIQPHLVRVVKSGSDVLSELLSVAGINLPRIALERGSEIRKERIMDSFQIAHNYLSGALLADVDMPGLNEKQSEARLLVKRSVDEFVARTEDSIIQVWRSVLQRCASHEAPLRDNMEAALSELRRPIHIAKGELREALHSARISEQNLEALEEIRVRLQQDREQRVGEERRLAAFN